MATLTGKTIANTYKDLLQVSNNNNGLTGTVQTISDGAGTNSALQLSNAAVNINGTFQLNGESLTVNASAINNMADIGSATGIIAVNSGSVYGRTLTAGAPVSITNANGTAGNPTITLASIANVSGSYGPFTNFGVNDYGQIVSATAVSTSVSVPTIRATELIAQTLTLSSNASIVGNLNVDGTFIVDGIVSAASDVAVGGSLYVTSNVSVTGNTKTNFLQAVSASIGKLNVGTLAYELVSVSALTANTLTIVSAATLAGTDLGTKITALETSIGTTNTLIATTSAALATSIGNSNTNITTNINAITSINSILGNGSGFATDAELQAVSATMATSIANHLPLAGGTLTGALQANSTITVGVDDTGYDVKFFGDTASAYMLWDASTDDLILGGAARLGIGTTAPGAELEIAGDYQPLIVNSTNSSGAKIILEDNGTTRGYLGATSTQPVTFYNSSATLIGCFDTNGTLLIGDTTTATGARLGVTGSDSAAGSLNYIMAIRNSDAYSTTPAGGILFQNKYTSGGAYADAGGIEVVKENATDGEYGFGLGLHTRANGAAITEKLRISGDGLVMIGGSASSYDTTPSQAGLSMYYETDSGLATIGTYSSGGATHLAFNTNTGGGANSEKVRVDSSGNVGIGTTSINQLLHLNSAAGAAINMTSGSGYLSQILLGTTAAPNHGRIQYNAGTGHMTWCTNDSSTAKMELDDAGALSITGALSKGSGSFKIDHPLPAKKDTHHLVHSFVEGPQADLIYRGRATLVAGQASINIDDAAGMTNGTFEVLCRDVQCFTSNETGWTAVKGSVSGVTLTIEAQDNTCTDTISWMVVGERKDQHMYDTNWTDDDGKVIVEPLKQKDE